MGLLGIMGYLGISTTSSTTQQRHTFHYLEECQVLIWRIIQSIDNFAIDILDKATN